jgi:NTP pyrophosphatase (non-canonical NTP hydrolase)
MNVPLTFDRLRERNVARCEDVFHPLLAWSPTDWATAFAGEAGEACNVVKKLRRLDGADKTQDTPENRERLRDQIATELADAVIYADLLAARIGRSLGDAVTAKFNEVSAKRGSLVML